MSLHPGLVTEIVWSVPANVHRAFVQLLDERTLQRRFDDPNRRIADLIPQRLHRDMPADVRAAIESLDGHLQETKQRQQFGRVSALACAALAGIAFSVAIAFSVHRRQPLTLAQWALVIGLGGVIGLLLYAFIIIFARLQCWEKQRKARRTKPRVIIRADRIAHHGGYQLLAGRFLTLASIGFIKCSDIERLSFHTVNLNGMMFDAMLIKPHIGSDLLLPINADQQSTDELMKYLREWRYPILKGDPMSIS